MVGSSSEGNSSTGSSIAGGCITGSRKKNRLMTKFLRDLWQSRGQILSVILLSMLGVWVFSGLDGYWRNLETSIEGYFDEQKLADLWVTIPSADKSTERRISRIEGVEQLQSRASIEVETVIPEGAKLTLHAVRDDFRVNIPHITRGGILWDNDYRGCLLDEKFAAANGFSPGDGIMLKIGERRYSFVIRGLVISPEYVFNSRDIIPEPEKYGFIFVKTAALSAVPINEICVLLSEDADAEAVKTAIGEELPRSFVRDRKAHNSTQMIRGEVSQFKSLSLVFPIMFFAVSALIVMTTMTRIVENQRTQMGLLKALGYNRARIIRHYLSFGLYPSLAGSACGLLIGRNTLPQFLWSILSELYVLPETRNAELSIAALAVCVLSVLMTCIICFFTCRRSISETSASLLRPKAPRAGSRILIERITVIWKHLSFSAKMIQRNLMRNRMRTIMALTGVLSCTALIITAFGMLDSMDFMVGTYYEKTLRYDLRAELDGTAGSVDKYRRRITADRTEGIMEMPVSIRKAADNGQGIGSSYDADRRARRGHPDEQYGSRIVLLTVYEDGQELIALEAAGTTVFDLKKAKNQILMTEKLAKVMGFNAGDLVKLKLPGMEEEDEAYIAGLVPVQLGQGLYMSERSWKRLERGVFTPTALLIRDPDEESYEYLESLDEVTEIKTLSSLKEKTNAGLESMSGVSVLMSVFALTLAFVVLYNMGILNFVERIREFATLKVLGFYRRETASLILKENIIVTLTGILSGIYPGIWLAELVMASSEPEDMVFKAVVDPLSIAAACGITFVFSLLIQCLLVRKVSGIVMVEALKSVE
jgi:putative ABC transport system permease protein